MVLKYSSYKLINNIKIYVTYFVTNNDTYKVINKGTKDVTKDVTKNVTITKSISIGKKR